MDIGKVQKIRTNVPGIIPVRNWPTPKPAQSPIHVPNWPTKKPAQVPVKKGN